LEWPAREGVDEEVSDLEQALACANRDFRLDGIVSGAIASEYQRTRLEGIGHRLGLKTFAPLWHKAAVGYLATLVAGGWDIRFSRCAALGVPAGWAGEALDATRLAALRSHAARPHPAGEGGEYETLALSAPCYRRRLVVDRARTEATASRATWVVEAWHTVPLQDAAEG
jgi:uncharacterized protein (TIGR00290 family)